MGGSLGFSKQKSKNRAFPFLRDTLGGAVGSVNTAVDGIKALLSGDTAGFDKYKTATGFNSILSEGLQGITGASAAKGLLRSGAAGKAFMNYGQDLQQKSAQNYIQNLLGLGGLGMGAGQTISGAGNVQKGSSKNLGIGGSGGGWGG